MFFNSGLDFCFDVIGLSVINLLGPPLHIIDQFVLLDPISGGLQTLKLVLNNWLDFFLVVNSRKHFVIFEAMSSTTCSQVKNVLCGLDRAPTSSSSPGLWIDSPAVPCFNSLK